MRDRLMLAMPCSRWFGLVVLVLASAASGCVIESNDCDEDDCPDCGGAGGSAGSGGGTTTPSDEVVVATIDADQTLETQPGEGIGAFIEYAEGGRWHVYTACDTDVSGLPCYFNVIATLPAGATYTVQDEESLEGEDQVYEYADGFELVTVTESDLDGVYVDASAGGVVRFEVWLDDAPDARFIYWIGGGAVHNGAPTNPIDLKPSVP